MTDVLNDRPTALDEARPGLAWIGEPDWEPHLRPLPFAAELAQLRARCASPQEFAARLPDAWVARLALAGSPAQVRERLDELGAAGVTTSVFIPAAADPTSITPMASPFSETRGARALVPPASSTAPNRAADTVAPF